MQSFILNCLGFLTCSMYFIQHCRYSCKGIPTNPLPCRLLLLSPLPLLTRQPQLSPAVVLRMHMHTCMWRGVCVCVYIYILSLYIVSGLKLLALFCVREQISFSFIFQNLVPHTSIVLPSLLLKIKSKILKINTYIKFS